MSISKKVSFKESVTAVNCERGKRFTVSPGKQYDLIEIRQARAGNGTVIVDFSDPTVNFMGGPDGKTELPCRLETQVPADQVTTS